MKIYKKLKEEKEKLKLKKEKLELKLKDGDVRIHYYHTYIPEQILELESIIKKLSGFGMIFIMIFGRKFVKTFFAEK